MSQQYPPHPPHPPPAPQPKKRRHTGLIVLGVIGAFMLVLFGGCAVLVASLGGDTSTVDAPAAAAPEGKDSDKSKAAGVGDAVKDGNLTFTVTGVKEKQTLGEGMLATEAQGKYVIVNVTVKNTGDEAATFNAGPSQVAYDKQGREYETSQDALMSGDAEDMNAFLEQINPGSKVKGRLVYDVPEKTKLVRVHLQGGTFTSGVEVDLR